MERISRAEEAAQHFHGLLQHEGIQSACCFSYLHSSDPESSLPRELRPAWTTELLTNKWRMFLLRMWMKIHPFIFSSPWQVAAHFQSTMAAWPDFAGCQALRPWPDSLYALWGALLPPAPCKVCTQLLKKSQNQNSTLCQVQHLGTSPEEAAEQQGLLPLQQASIYNLPVWRKKKTCPVWERQKTTLRTSPWFLLGTHRATTEWSFSFSATIQAVTPSYIQNREMLGITGKTEKSELDVFLSCIFSQPPILLQWRTTPENIIAAVITYSHYIKLKMLLSNWTMFFQSQQLVHSLKATVKIN